LRHPAAVRSHWLKALGHARWRLPDDWLAGGGDERLRRTGFPRRPRIAPGDRLVLYASGWRSIFAVVEAVDEPTDAHPVASDPARWPWTVAVEPLLCVPLLHAAPPVEAAGVLPRSMSQQSHIRLTPEQYARAVEAIGSVGL
jgi:hypothetical protein